MGVSLPVVVNCLLGLSAIEVHEVGGEDSWLLCLTIAVGFSQNMNRIAQILSDAKPKCWQYRRSGQDLVEACCAHSQRSFSRA